MVDVPHVTPQDIDDTNTINTTNTFNAIITTPSHPISNGPIINNLGGTELDIEHNLNTNSHHHHDENSLSHIPHRRESKIKDKSNNSNNNNNNNKSTSSSRRSSRSSGRNKKKRDKNHHTLTPSGSGRKRRRRSNKENETTSNSQKVSASTSKYVTIKADVEASVKGGAGNGYRMVLDEPVNKSMLSCHQCKNKKTLDRIIVCGHVYRINNTVKTCTKKYCKSCLLRFYLEAPPTDNKDPTWSSWKCPCCRYICCCAWCRKKKAKRLESVSNAIRAEAHRLTPAISLARKLVSESRVNSNISTHRTHRTRSNNMNIPPEI